MKRLAALLALLISPLAFGQSYNWTTLPPIAPAFSFPCNNTGSPAPWSSPCGIGASIPNGTFLGNNSGATGAVTAIPISTIAGTGTVNSGLTNQIAVYTSNGQTIGGTYGITLADLQYLALVVSGAPSATNSWVYSVGGWSGTGAYAGTPQRWAAHWDYIPDTAAFPNTGVGATGLAGDYECYDNLQSGWDGFRFCYEGFSIVNAAPQTISYLGSQVSTNVTNTKCRVQFNVSMGGLPGSYGGGNGTGFCLNSFNTALTNAAWLALLSNEFDLNSSAFVGPVATKFGLNVTLAGNCGASSTCVSEAVAGYDNIMYLAGNADDKGTSYLNCIFCIGSKSHNAPVNLTSTMFGAEQRWIGSGTKQFNTPSARYGFRCEFCNFAQPLTGTWTATIASITPDPGGTHTAVTFTFSSAMSGIPPMGSIASVTGSSIAAYNHNYVVLGNGTTTTALVSTVYMAAGTDIACSSSCGTITITEPQGESLYLPDVAASPTGTFSAAGFQVGPGGISQGNASISSITVDPEPYGGNAGMPYVGGALFGSTNPGIVVDTPNGEIAPTVSGINSFVQAALLYTDLTSFVSSAAGAPNGTQVQTSCNNGDQIQVTSGTSSVPATLTIATDGAGHATGITIVNSGAYTQMGGAPPLTFTLVGGAACTNTAGFISSWLQIGWGLVSPITLSANGANFPPGVAPYVYTTGYTGKINTEPKLIANLSVTPMPVNLQGGIQINGGPTINSIPATLAQGSLPVTAVSSGFIDANGNLIIGANPPNSVFLSSSTAGTGITITCNSACFTGTAAGDTGRQFTFSDGGSPKTFAVTGNSGSSTTIAQGTLNTTLTTACTSGAPCAAAGVYETGTNGATNTAAAGVTYPAPLAVGYPSGYYAIGVSSAAGAAGVYYGTTSGATDLSVIKLYNNLYTTGTPTIPIAPTAFSGLTPAFYTQATSALALLSTSVPANSLGLNGCIVWDFTYQYDLSANSKTVAGKLTSSGLGIAATTFGYGTMQSRVCNAGAAAVQSMSATYTAPTATTVQTGSPAWSAVNTALSQTANIQVTLAAATDTLTVSNYSISERPN